MEYQNNIIDESENWNGGFSKGSSFKEIVLSQLSKCVKNLSEEQREGFWITSTPNMNMTSQKIRYVGDSRAESKNSLDVLHDLLMPKFDEEMKKSSEEIYEKYESIYSEAKESSDKNRRNDYWTSTLKIYRTLFQKICLFLERIGWLEVDSLEN